MATVLFADLAGFTGMSETLDPEHLKNLVDRCFVRVVGSRLLDAVVRDVDEVVIVMTVVVVMRQSSGSLSIRIQRNSGMIVSAQSCICSSISSIDA